MQTLPDFADLDLDIEEVLDDVRGVVRRHPLLVTLAALAVGVLVGRALRARRRSAAASADRDAQAETARFAPPGAGAPVIGPTGSGSDVDLSGDLTR